jgi:MoxR-like ATPase
MGERAGVDIEAVREGLSRVLRGKPDAIELLLIAVLSGGHVLLEDVPGVGKTTLGKALALCFGADFGRVQFTPDLLPADIVGAQILNPENGTLSFRAGPVFTHVLLADEINRASPRTQSALLEAMNELQVTVEGTTHALPRPFCVIATQNPIGFQGTYPLPEAQLDRFNLSFGIGHPAPDVELDILFAHQHGDPLGELEPMASVADLLATQEAVQEVRVKPEVAQYMLRIVEATRSHPRIDLGVSTRGALAWFRAAQARAFLSGRDYASPDDFQFTAVPVLAHRLQLATEARYAGKTSAAVVAELLEEAVLPL